MITFYETISNEDMVAVQKRLADALKPHCSRCGKAGAECKRDTEKRRHACLVRSIRRAKVARAGATLQGGIDAEYRRVMAEQREAAA